MTNKPEEKGTGHTPTPLGLNPELPNEIANVLAKNLFSKEEIAFIVRAINAHEALLIAAKAMREELASRDSYHLGWDVAIALVEGEVKP